MDLLRALSAGLKAGTGCDDEEAQRYAVWVCGRWAEGLDDVAPEDKATRSPVHPRHAERGVGP